MLESMLTAYALTLVHPFATTALLIVATACLCVLVCTTVVSIGWLKGGWINGGGLLVNPDDYNVIDLYDNDPGDAC